jgi:hypothetical protein
LSKAGGDAISDRAGPADVADHRALWLNQVELEAGEAMRRISCMLFVVTLAVLAACGRGEEEAAPEQGAHTSAELSARIAALQERLAALQKEAALIKDANDIKRLQRAYGYYVDKALWDQVADLFAEDGSAEYANEGVYVGRERIRKYLYLLGGGKSGLSHGQLNNHTQLQPVVHVSPDGMTAKGRWRAFIQSGQYGTSASWGEGTYENEYVKEDGVWKIKKLHWYVTFVAPYETGWGKMEPMQPLVSEASKQFPPDRPPSEDYLPFPGVYVPPFHYDNPVSGRSRSELPPTASAPNAAQGAGQ